MEPVKKLGGRVWLVVAFAVWLSGCAAGSASHREFVAAPGVVTVGSRLAVMPLDNLTDYPNAGNIVAELLRTELYGQGLFTLSTGVTAEEALTVTSATDKRHDVLARARTLGAEYLLQGTVLEFGYRFGMHDRPVVGLSARLLRVADGTVLWAASESVVGSGLMDRSSVNQVAQQAVRRMVEGLKPLVAGNGQ